MRRIINSFALLLIFLLCSCSADDEISDVETNITGIWKPIATQYLDNEGGVDKTILDDDSACLRKSLWVFTQNQFSLRNFTD